MSTSIPSLIKYYTRRVATCQPVFRLISLFAPKHAVRDDEYSQSRQYIESVYPDAGSTCVGDNSLSDIGYDAHIIIPAYNVGPYVAECLDSIFSQQTAYSYFVTIVNDGSADNTLEVIRRYAGRPNIEIIDQPNRGPSAARNAALRHIRGRYIVPIDSDDRVDPLYLERLLEKAMACDADIVQAALYVFDNDNSILRNVTNTATDEDIRYCVKGFACGKAFKSSLFKHVVYPEGLIFEDTIVSMLLVAMSSKIYILPDNLYGYRSNAQGITQTYVSKPKVIDTYYVTEAVVKAAEELGCADQYVFEQFLAQTRMNARRSLALGDKQLMRHLYVCHQKMYNDYYSRRFSSTRNRNMQRAFDRQSYWLWLLSL